MKQFLSLAVMTLLCSSVFGQNRAAQSELDTLIGSYVEGYCESIKGDSKAFQFSVLPYGPLDLQVEKGRSREEIKQWKNFYLGVVGGAANVDAASLSASFSCGKACHDYRKNDVVNKLHDIGTLVQEFNNTLGLHVVSNWGMQDQYRVNNVFHMVGQTKEALASPIMGFVPSGTWREVKSIESYLTQIGVPQERFNSILNRTKELSLAAIVRMDDGSIKIIRVGIGNKESGLVFTKEYFSKSAKEQRPLDSETYPTQEVVEPGVTYFETIKN